MVILIHLNLFPLSKVERGPGGEVKKVEKGKGMRCIE